MHFINPFKGLRPTEEKASSVSIPSTDHLSQEVITNHKKSNPWSYLNIFSNKIHSKAKEQFELMKNNSIIKKDSTRSFYIYKISTKNHSQVGVIGTAKLSAYDNLHIRGHEEIYLERSQKRFDQINNLNAQVGPIYVVHPDDIKLAELIKEQIALKPIYSFDALDKCHHELWIINEDSAVLKISEIFNTINRIYIADGHHRIEALSKFAEFKKHQNPNNTGKEAYNYFMVAIFPKSQARILDYNRLIKDLYGYSPKDFIKQIPNDIVVEVPAMVNNKGINGIKLENYPDNFASILVNQVGTIRLTTAAVLEKSKSLAFQALLADPVVDNYQSAEKLLDTMMTFQNEHLGYLK